MLSDPTIALTPNGVRSLMSLVLMACFDRKVERNFFGEMLDHSAEAGIIMAKLEGGVKLRAAIKLLKGVDTKVPEIDEQMQDLMKEWNRKRALLADKFELVRQCPTSADTIS